MVDLSTVTNLFPKSSNETASEAYIIARKTNKRTAVALTPFFSNRLA